MPAVAFLLTAKAKRKQRDNDRMVISLSAHMLANTPPLPMKACVSMTEAMLDKFVY